MRRLRGVAGVVVVVVGVGGVVGGRVVGSGVGALSSEQARERLQLRGNDAHTTHSRRYRRAHAAPRRLARHANLVDRARACANRNARTRRRRPAGAARTSVRTPRPLDASRVPFNSVALIDGNE